MIGDDQITGIFNGTELLGAYPQLWLAPTPNEFRRAVEIYCPKYSGRETELSVITVPVDMDAILDLRAEETEFIEEVVKDDLGLDEESDCIERARNRIKRLDALARYVMETRLTSKD